MSIFREEIFGPIACFYSFHDHHEVLRLANSTSAGLAAYVFTNSPALQRYYGEELEFAMVGLNSSDLAIGPQIPFGGLKESGLGREGGRGCLREYGELRVLRRGF
jgi:acyl-CoA reductase-like NAD-dependent aldehyde dehydrogenase